MFDIFKKKHNKKDFYFVGNRPHLRTEEEKSLVNKQEADLAFKRYKREIIDDLLLGNGFYKYKTNAYVRLNNIGLLEYVDLQKERYGSKTFCVNFAAMPLYCVNKYIIVSLGGRLGTYISGKDVWWDYASENVAKASFENVSMAIEKYMFPWFEEVSTEEGYRAKLQQVHSKKLAAEWLDALENIQDKETLIEQNIVELRLPKKIRKYKEL
ncbi:MAG: DUF4304 domain-containing protein [Lachnospiraceae bacterium]|nr:DUF4304 domain-containing protein [Lachnospiraceae bacterium]